MLTRSDELAEEGGEGSLLESDLFVAYLKKVEWLKPLAKRVIGAIEAGRLRGARASTEVFHEMYYAFSDSAPLDTLLLDFAKVSTIRNLEFRSPSVETYLSALNLAKLYEMTSVFDAIHAATALSTDNPDHKIISTDEAFDKVSGLERLHPKDVLL